MAKLRGNDISMIFQEPMTALNPVLKIGDQIQEGNIQHRNISKREARKKAIEMLEFVSVPRLEKLWMSIHINYQVVVNRLQAG